MKILIITPDFYDPNLSEFKKNRTGFGMMVREIIGGLSKKNDVIVFTKTLTKGHIVQGAEHFNIVKHSIFTILFFANVLDYLAAIKSAIKYNQSFTKRIKYFLYTLNQGACRRYIKKYKPDVVNIHGISFSTWPLIQLVNGMNVPFCVTLHGCIGINEQINLSPHEKKLEEEFLRYSEKNSINVTTISEGTKLRLVEHYKLKRSDFITVIRNGVSMKHDFFEYDIFKKHTINRTDKIILVVGSIYPVKNQVQIVDAFHFLTEEQKSNTTVLFIGQCVDNGELESKIKNCKYSHKMKLCGFVSHNEIGNYYKAANLNIIASKSEGFGLSSIEAFSYGVPTVIFADLDAVPDIYSEDAVSLVYDRSSNALGNEISKALNKNWNKEKIKEYSAAFSMENTVQEYTSFYTKLANSFI